MSSLLGRRAVVIGAGIGGLSAAGALAPHFERVDVLERDHLASFPTPRPGTPQDRHPHFLLAGGLQALDEIFPDFKRELASAGAVPASIAEDVQYERADIGAMPRRAFDIPVLCASRPLIEFVLRRRTETIENVSLHPKCRVMEIAAASDGTVYGVRFRTPKGNETLDADLVVDASGRGTPTLDLLDSLGWQRPEVTDVGVDISYSTAIISIPANVAPDCKIMVAAPNPPTVSANAVLLPRESNRWTVLLAQYQGVRGPDTWDALLNKLRGTITSSIHDAVRQALPPKRLRHYMFPASVWRHFEKLPRLPHGVLPLGDAICRFNPIYGQGMTVAAKEAHLLQDELNRAVSEPDPIAALQAGFMAQVTSVLQTPWDMSTRADLAFPATRGTRPENFEEGLAFEAALFRAAAADAVVHRALMEVAQLLQPGSRLQDPEIKRRIEAVSPSQVAAA